MFLLVFSMCSNAPKQACIGRWPHLFTYYIVGQNVLRNQVVFYNGIGRIISGHIADRAGNYNISVATPTPHIDRQFLFLPLDNLH